MQEILNKVRLYLSMDEADFAETLGVTTATVKRWENGKSQPGKRIQTRLYDLCKKRQVPVYNMILEKIETASENINLETNRILLYHGSKSGIKGKIEPRSRKQCDFGQGFYMGTEPSQPLTLICDYEKSRFYIISISISDLQVLDIPAYIEWAMLVAYHRGRMESIKDSPFYNKYRDMDKDADLVVGRIANDRMFYVIDNFFVGNITDKALINSLAALKLGKQYVAVSRKACDAVRIEAEIPISDFERHFIQEVASENRDKGVSLANMICKDYRREGLFFDEILEKVIKGDLS